MFCIFITHIWLMSCLIMTIWEELIRTLFKGVKRTILFIIFTKSFKAPMIFPYSLMRTTYNFLSWIYKRRQKLLLTISNWILFSKREKIDFLAYAIKLILIMLIVFIFLYSKLIRYWVSFNVSRFIIEIHRSNEDIELEAF